MKKRILILLSVMMVATALWGCGAKAQSETAGAKTEVAETAGVETAGAVLESPEAANQTDTDEAAVHLPQAGEDLATALDNEHLKNIAQDPPVSVSIWIDHGGPAETAELTDGEEIAEFITHFSKVRIESETLEMVTDNYNGISLTFGDGETVSISLNLKNLEYSVGGEYHIYVLSDFDDLWNYMNEVADFPEEE